MKTKTNIEENSGIAENAIAMKAFNFESFQESMGNIHTANKTLLQENTRVDEVLANKRSYNQPLMEGKLIKDAQFLQSLGNTYIQESIEALYENKDANKGNAELLAEDDAKIIKLSEDGKDFETLFENVLIDCIDIFQEINENAVIYADTSDNLVFNDADKKVLTEAEEVNAYVNKFKKNISAVFGKPIQENTFNELYSAEVNIICESVALNNASNDIDVEVLSKYAIFESLVQTELKNVLLPGNTQETVKLFEESQDPSYYEMFERNSKVIMESINTYTHCMSQLIAPKMFAAGFGDTGLNPEDLRGTSTLLNK